jgi:hypothetical protein
MDFLSFAIGFALATVICLVGATLALRFFALRVKLFQDGVRVLYHAPNPTQKTTVSPDPSDWDEDPYEKDEKASV